MGETFTQPLPYILESSNKKNIRWMTTHVYTSEVEEKWRFQFDSYYILMLPRILPRCLCVLSSSRFEPKRKETAPDRARCACVMRLSYPYVFPARFSPSINTDLVKGMVWYLLNVTITKDTWRRWECTTAGTLWV